MIGTKKLSTIRDQIETAFATISGNAIQNLDRKIASAKRKGDRTELLEGLKRFLDLPQSERPKTVAAPAMEEQPKTYEIGDDVLEVIHQEVVEEGGEYAADWGD